MNAQPPEEKPGRPNGEELSPKLGEAVQRIVADGPPEDLARRSIERLRGLDPTEARPRSVQHTTRRLAAVLALAAAACFVGILAVWHFSGGQGSDREFVREVPSTPGLFTPPEPAGTEVALDTSGNRTLWSYHEAAQRSPEDLVALLDEHSDQEVFSGSESLSLGIPLLIQEAML